MNKNRKHKKINRTVINDRKAHITPYFHDVARTPVKPFHGITPPDTLKMDLYLTILYLYGEGVNCHIYMDTLLTNYY